MTRVLATVWALVATLLFARAYGAQASWEEALHRLGRPHEYQSAAMIMSVVAVFALLVAATIAMRSPALFSLPMVTATALLFIYAALLLALGSYRHEPAYATVAVLALLLASAVTFASAVFLRKRSEA